jgi:hypothetical protein
MSAANNANRLVRFPGQVRTYVVTVAFQIMMGARKAGQERT